jgi:hypothetical protein
MPCSFFGLQRFVPSYSFMAARVGGPKSKILPAGSPGAPERKPARPPQKARARFIIY